MGQIYLIADTHFGHKSIIVFENAYRPFASIEDHDRELVARWNATVGKKDTVWHLGDVFFGKDTHLILGKLNGIKRLVLGNHDIYPYEIYTRYFTKIFGAAELRDCILTHIPVHQNQLEWRYTTNIHGHLHSKVMDDSRYHCVSVEHTGLKPVLLSNLLGDK